MARSVSLFVAAALGGVRFLFGAPVVFSADDAAIEHGALVGFYEWSQTKPEVRVDGNPAVQIPTTTGTSTVFSQSNADVQLTRTREIIGLRYLGRAGSLRYSAMIGQPRRFEVEFDSGTATNRLDATDEGFVCGVGLGGSFVPASIASVGIGWDLQYQQSRVNFERFVSGGVQSPANQRLVEDEIQGAVTAIKRFGQLAPYTGLKVARWITRLEDKGTGAQVRGYVDGVSALIGLEWSPTQAGAGFVEASFFDEESVSAGWELRF